MSCGLTVSRSPSTPVDQHQRSAARTDRAGTADVDGRRARRLAVAHRDIEVGDRALQRTRDARIGAFGELPAVHLIHGTDQVAALDRTVTHDDDLFEDLLVLAQRHVERTPGADLLFEGLESQVHEDQHGAASRNGKRVAAVGIGGGAVRVFFTSTLTPASGSPCSSVTRPATVCFRCCAALRAAAHRTAEARTEQPPCP